MLEIDGHQVVTSLGEKVDPHRAAVIVVDMQKDFCYSGFFSDRLGIDVNPMHAVAERIATFLDAARKRGVMVVHAHSNYDAQFMSAPMYERLHRLGLSPYCQSGNEGIEPHPALVPQKGDIVITKHRFDAFIDTALDMVLRNAGIETVIMTGTTTHGCVDSTARHAYFRDYYVVLVDDLVCGANEQAHDVTMATINQCFGVTADSGTLLRTWQAQGEHGAA